MSDVLPEWMPPSPHHQDGFVAGQVISGCTKDVVLDLAGRKTFGQREKMNFNSVPDFDLSAQFLQRPDKTDIDGFSFESFSFSGHTRLLLVSRNDADVQEIFGVG